MIEAERSNADAIASGKVRLRHSTGRSVKRPMRSTARSDSTRSTGTTLRTILAAVTLSPTWTVET